jgi:hypothetical protein
LKELIVIAIEDDNEARIGLLRLGISEAQVDIPEEIRWVKEEYSGIQFPAVKVMTEAMLVE